jgi:hypothetical protein
MQTHIEVDTRDKVFDLFRRSESLSRMRASNLIDKPALLNGMRLEDVRGAVNEADNAVGCIVW